MRKFISICLCVSLLCGCGGMRGLQRQSTQNIHKTIKENNEIYWNDKKGHTDNVKMYVVDQHHVQIKIPIVYNEKVENIEKIRAIPSLKDDPLIELKELGKCENCTFDVDRKYVVIDLLYKGEGGVELCASAILYSAILLPVVLVGTVFNFTEMKKMYKEACSANILQLPDAISVEDPTNGSKLRNMGLINVNFKVIPQRMNIICDKKACAVLDSDGEYVNEIIIDKNITINQQRISQLVEQENKAEAKRKAEEAKQQAEEARRKAEEERKWKQRKKLQEKECPGLYRTLYWAQQTGYIDPIIGMKTAQRFDELDCNLWLNSQLY